MKRILFGLATFLTMSLLGVTATAHSDVTDTLKLYPTPSALTVACRRSASRVTFRVLCPSSLPRAHDGTRASGGAYVQRSPNGDWVELDAGYGTPTDPQDWSLNNPSFFLHLILIEGHPPASVLELPGAAVGAARVGSRTIAGHAGVVYREKSWSTCHCAFGGHYVFVWRDRTITYAVSLHRWTAKPTMALLERLVASLTRARP